MKLLSQTMGHPRRRLKKYNDELLADVVKRVWIEGFHKTKVF